MKAKKIMAFLAALTLATGLLAGCNGDNQPPTTSAQENAAESSQETAQQSTETGEIEVWFYGWVPDALKLVQEDALAYSEKNPGVTVNITPIAMDVMNEKLNATMAGGTNPDVAMAPSGIKPVAMASKGVLLSVEDMGLSDIASKFYPSLWDANMWEDEVYAIPITANNLALYYNKELFDNAGLDYPSDSWTWEDLTTNAKALTDPSAGIYGLDIQTYSTGAEWNVFMFCPFLFQSGGNILSDDLSSSAFDSEPTREALQLYNQLLNVDESMPRQAPGAGIDRFASGLVGMHVNTPWTLKTYMEDPEMKDRVGVAPLPHNKENATVIGGEVMVAFSNTKHPQIVSNYLRHITTDSDFLEKFYETWVTVSPLEEYKDMQSGNPAYDEMFKIFTEQMDIGQSRQFVPQWPEIENTVNTALVSYLYNGADMDEALATADNEINKILSEK